MERIKLAAWVVVAAVFFIAVQSCGDAPGPASSRASADAAKPARECREQHAARVARFVDLQGAGKYWEAASAVRTCAALLGDSELQGLVRAGEVAHWLHVGFDTRKPLETRADALARLAKDYPDAVGGLAPHIDRLVMSAEQKRAASERAWKRSQGVKLGMTPEDVLASSWGKPSSVNRTTTAAGVSEQWVYSGGYLYFRDGVLVGIQN